MRLACFDDDRAGVVVEDHVLDLTVAATGEGVGPPLRVPDLCQMGLAWALELVERLQANAPVRPLADVRLRAPIGRPGLIVVALINYGDHQLEMRQQYDVSGLGIFLKAPLSVIGPGDDIQLPYHDRRFDHEGELAVVVGANTRRSVPVEEARSLVSSDTRVCSTSPCAAARIDRPASHSTRSRRSDHGSSSLSSSPILACSS